MKIAVRTHRTLSQLLLFTGATMASAVALLYLARTLVPAALLHAHNDVAGTYLQTVGTVYGVLLA